MFWEVIIVRLSSFQIFQIIQDSKSLITSTGVRIVQKVDLSIVTIIDSSLSFKEKKRKGGKKEKKKKKKKTV